jgi:hypothetical protein
VQGPEFKPQYHINNKKIDRQYLKKKEVIVEQRRPDLENVCACVPEAPTEGVPPAAAGLVTASLLPLEE